MDIDDDAVTDPAAEFGELFEGQTVAFENELGGHDDIGDGMRLATASRRSSHPSDQEILGDNLPFVPDDYFQQQQIVVEGETSEVGTKSTSKSKKAPASGPEGKKPKAKQTPKKQQQQKQKQTQNQKQLNGSASTIPGQGQVQSQPIPITVPVSAPAKTPAVKGKSPVSKKGKSKKATPTKSTPFIKKEVLDTHIQAPPQGALLPMVTIKTEPPDYPVAKILPLPAPAETPKPPQSEEQKQKKKVMIVKDVKHFTIEIMERYMKRRGFKTKHEKKGPVQTIKSVSRGVFALTAANQMTTATSSIRVVSFGTKYEPDLVIEEIEKFWKFYLWIKCKSVTMSSELVPMLVPILLHFYFEMLHANLYPFAKRIILEFSKTFLHEDRTKEHYDLIVALLKINNSEAIKKDTSLKPRLNRKFEFILSEITIIQLRRFLAKLDEPILINLFTEHFKIRTRESKEFFESLIWEDLLDSEDSRRRRVEGPDSDSSSDSESESSDCEDVYQVGQIDDDVKSAGASECATNKRYVDEVIDELRNTVEANLPAISVFTTGNRPISGAISKKGTLMAFGLQDAGIRLYPVERSRDMCQMSYDSPSTDGVKFIGGHAGSVYGVHFHPRTKLLFSAGQDSFMRVWDLNGEDPACKAVYRGHFGPIWKIDIPESGSLVATAGLDTTARIFLPEKTEFVRVMVGHYFSVNTVKFHPNEAYIATGSADKSVRLWSVNDGNIVRMYTGSMGTVNCLAFHESGKYLAGAGEDDKIIIWDLAKGEALSTLNCLRNCRDLTFSGYMLTACFRNGSLQVFNLRPLLGGDEGDAFEQLFSGSVSAPYTTSCFVKTLFKVQYQDPGRLYCLGSDLPVEEDDFIRVDKPTTTEPESMYDVLLGTEESLADDAATMSSPAGSLPCSPMSCLEPATPTLLHQVLQNAPGPSTDISTSTTSVADDGGDAMETDPISDVIEGNAPVETMMLQETPPPEVTVGASQPQAAPTTSTPQMISASDLDAAIASVIDQSGCESSGGTGTITMYASS